jgi:hypothetical protein
MSDPNSSIRDNAAGDGVETTGNNAAQGRTGTHTFKVLIASLILVVLVLFGLFFFALPHLSSNQGAGGQSGTNNPAAAAMFNTDTSAPKQAPPGAPSTTGGPQGTDTRTGNTTN